MKKLKMAEGVVMQESDGEFILKPAEEVEKKLLRLEEENAFLLEQSGQASVRAEKAEDRADRLKKLVTQLRATADRLEAARDNWHTQYLAEAAKRDEETMAVTMEKLKEQLSHGDERKQEYLRRLEELDDWFNA